MGKSNLIHDGNIVYSSRDYTLFYKELNKLKRSLGQRDYKKIFMISYKGHKFNCLPFLLNGSGYFSQTYRSSLTDSIARLSAKPEPFYTSELNNVDGLDIKVFDSVIPALSDMGTRMLGAYQYMHHPKEVVNLLFRGSVEVFEAAILNGDTIHYNYKYNDICNTQAFCYYLSIVWLMSLSPLLYSLCAKDLRHAKFDNLMSQLLPEDSIHFKYICGELSCDELREEYLLKRYSDNSSICIREIMSNSTSGEYSGEELNYKDIGMCEEIYDTYTLNEDYRTNMHLAYCFLYDGTYDRLNSEISSQTMAKERENEKATKNDIKLKKVRDDLKTANDIIRIKDKEIISLRNELRSIKTDDKLKEEILELKCEVKRLKTENEHLFTERTSMKQLISAQKKKLKSVSTSSIDETNNDSCLEDICEDINSVSIDEAVNAIKDLRITYVVCDNNNSIDSKLNSLGLVNITRFNSNQRTIGKCDALVIFSIMCHHSDVYRAEKLCGGRDIPIIYLNCVNIEQMIFSIYNTMCK